MAKPEEVTPPDDAREPDAPPKEPPKPTRDRKKPRGRPSGSVSVKHIEDGFNQLFAMLSVGFMMQGDIYMADLFTERGPKLATAYANMARRNPKVRAILEKLVSAGELGEVGFATLSVALPALAHYGILPPLSGMFMGPFAFESETEKAMAAMQGNGDHAPAG